MQIFSLGKRRGDRGEETCKRYGNPKKLNKIEVHLVVIIITSGVLLRSIVIQLPQERKSYKKAKLIKVIANLKANKVLLQY